MSIIGAIVITALYQPFLNVLVATYELLDRYAHIADMGIAVIVFTVLLRIVLLPLTLASSESEEEQRKIGYEYQRIKEKYQTSQPLLYREKKKQLAREHSSTVKFQLLNISIQIGIALILWRIFSTGIKGEDLHLIYNVVPRPEHPFNLTLLGKLDLTRPSLLLNFLTAMLLFLVETLSLLFSPLPPSREERMLQVIVPIGVFIYLYSMPAGKKLFLVVTLTISILIMLFREVVHVIRLARG